MNLGVYSDIASHWVALYERNNDVNYLDFFGVEPIPKEVRIFISNKNIKTNISRIQAYDLILCGHFCIGFIDFMLAGKTLTEFTNLFSSNNLKKKWWYNFKLFHDKCLKLAENDFHETPNMYPNLNAIPQSNQQQFRPNKIN